MWKKFRQNIPTYLHSIYPKTQHVNFYYSVEAFYHAKSIIKMNEGNEGTEKTLKWWNEKRKKKQMKGFRNLFFKKTNETKTKSSDKFILESQS